MLEKFCLRGRDEEPTRAKLKTTWIKNGWEYATDTVVCVRRRFNFDDTVPTDNLPYPDAAKVFAEALEAAPCPSAKTEIVVPMLEEPKQCKSCLGTGHEAQPCEVCGGDGRHWCGECSASHQCGRCSGLGIDPIPGGDECQDCDGTGEIRHVEDVRLGGWLFPVDRLVRLMEAGATHICVPKYGTSDRCYGYGVFNDADVGEIEFVLCSKIDREKSA